MAQYHRGATFERTVIEHLEGFGWASVRAAGSKGDTKSDIVSFHPTGLIMLVQCKLNGIISAEEWNRIHEIALWGPTTLAVIADKPARGKIGYWRITGERIPYKPNMNREPFDPAVSPVSAAALMIRTAP